MVAYSLKYNLILSLVTTSKHSSIPAGDLFFPFPFSQLIFLHPIPYIQLSIPHTLPLLASTPELQSCMQSDNNYSIAQIGVIELQNSRYSLISHFWNNPSYLC